jgi:hypothetical protein
MLHEWLSVFVEVGGKGNFSFEDVPVDAHRILVIEGVDASVHLIDQYSESPPVNSFSVTLIEDDLRGDVFWGSTDGEGSALGQKLGKTEVCEFEVAVIANEQIFWL